MRPCSRCSCTDVEAGWSDGVKVGNRIPGSICTQHALFGLGLGRIPQPNSLYQFMMMSYRALLWGTAVVTLLIADGRSLIG